MFNKKLINICPQEKSFSFEQYKVYQRCGYLRFADKYLKQVKKIEGVELYNRLITEYNK